MPTMEQSSFAKSVLSGADGSGSTSRLCALLIVVVVLGWGTFAVVKAGGKIPDLGGLEEFLAVTTGSTYGVSKAAEVVAARTARVS